MRNVSRYFEYGQKKAAVLYSDLQIYKLSISGSVNGF